MSDEAARIAELEGQVARLTEQCTAARSELEALTYAVSHDLRAPLRSLSGFSQALLEMPNVGSDPKAPHYLNRIQQASRKLSDLIDALLTLSRIARADMQVRTVDLTQLCDEAAKAVAARHPKRHVKIDIQANMSVQADSRLLRAALEALIDNAYKFTASRPNSIIHIGQADSTYFVRDNGVGFDMRYAEKLFRPFQRLHPEAEFPGIGTGLALAQRVIQRHGGNFNAAAKPDEGATFSFSLPGSLAGTATKFPDSVKP